MRLLFAYFDFSKQDDRPTSFHLDKEYGLNFSTKHFFSINRKKLASKSERPYEYYIHQEPIKECIPEGFWGKRIYNITAIVGDNGSGKSSLLHSIIRAVVYGLDPGVPFLLIMQDTDSDKLRLYCSDKDAFIWNGQGTCTPRMLYPNALKKTKSMLLDNTLSLSTYQLANDYNKFIDLEFDQEHKRWEKAYQESEKDPGPEPEPFLEWQKQLNNKSLLASIQFSNNMSTDSVKKTRPPVSTIMYNHFGYESFQEVRFLFDKYYQEILDKLQEKYPIPRPGHIYVSVTPAVSLCNIYPDIDLTKPNIWTNIIDSFDLQGFVGKIMIDALINLLCITVLPTAEEQDTIAPINIEWFDRMSNLKGKPSIETLKKAAYQKINELEWCLEKPIVPFKVWSEFFAFVAKEQKTLQEIFRISPATPDSISDAEYIIHDKEITSDPEKRRCLISFLDKYKQICEPRYFLTFHSGMSSGEKNLLRMLTQFRYVLRGPMYNDIVDKEVTSLKNRFHYGSHYCDTLFLFLDEVDLTYHPEWQRIIIAMLNDVLPLMFNDPYVKKGDHAGGCRDIQVILATHSPLILSDFPKASAFYLKKQEKGKQHTQRSTFGENLYTILRDGFFMDDSLGAFAKEKIDKTVKWCADIREYCNKRDKPNGRANIEREKELSQDYEKHFKTMQLLSPGIIQNKLILELNECAIRLPIPKLKEMLEAKKQDDQNALKRQIDELQEKLLQAERQIDELKKGNPTNE